MKLDESYLLITIINYLTRSNRREDIFFLIYSPSKYSPMGWRRQDGRDVKPLSVLCLSTDRSSHWTGNLAELRNHKPQPSWPFPPDRPYLRVHPWLWTNSANIQAFVGESSHSSRKTKEIFETKGSFLKAYKTHLGTYKTKDLLENLNPYFLF